MVVTQFQLSSNSLLRGDKIQNEKVSSGLRENSAHLGEILFTVIIPCTFVMLLESLYCMYVAMVL
jgi:hypothetical protein